MSEQHQADSTANMLSNGQIRLGQSQNGKDIDNVFDLDLGGSLHIPTAMSIRQKHTPQGNPLEDEAMSSAPGLSSSVTDTSSDSSFSLAGSFNDMNKLKSKGQLDQTSAAAVPGQSDTAGGIWPPFVGTPHYAEATDDNKYPRISRTVELMRSSYDCVVIGSGYGGGVAASRMARAGKSVCLLELGKERWPGEYPSSSFDSFDDLHCSGDLAPSFSGGVKVDTGHPTGMYHLIFGKGQNALVANGASGILCLAKELSCR